MNCQLSLPSRSEITLSRERRCDGVSFINGVYVRTRDKQGGHSPREEPGSPGYARLRKFDHGCKEPAGQTGVYDLEAPFRSKSRRADFRRCLLSGRDESVAKATAVIIGIPINACIGANSGDAQIQGGTCAEIDQAHSL